MIGKQLSLLKTKVKRLMIMTMNTSIEFMETEDVGDEEMEVEYVIEGKLEIQNTKDLEKIESANSRFQDAMNTDSLCENYNKNENDHDKDEGETKNELLCITRAKGGPGRKLPWLLFNIVLVAAFAVLVAYYFAQSPCRHNYNNIAVFTDKLKMMNNDFPNQYEVFWNMLRNGGNRHLKKLHNGKKEEQIPLSYLVAGYAGSSKTVDCFVARLNDVYTTDSKQVLDSHKFSGDNDKMKLVKEMKAMLKGTKRIIIVKDIEKLQFKVAQLFISFTAKHLKVSSYPQSILILTTELPFSYVPGRSRHSDEDNVGIHFKNNIWSGEHETTSLWSRVSERLILVRKEEHCPCNE